MNKATEFSIYVYGDFKNVGEAQNALQLPFIEDFVSEHGKFRLHNLDNIRVARGIALGELLIAQIGDGKFEISCDNPHKPLNKTRIEELAELLDVYDMFDEIEITEKS